MRKIIIILIALVLYSCGSNTKNAQSLEEVTPAASKDEQIQEKVTKLPDNPTINLELTIKNETTVSFLITTNIPLPIECMLGLNLQGQKPDDTWIGSSRRIRIESSPLTYDLDISADKLPSGNYNGEVDFYPNWGADNGNVLAKSIKNQVKGAVIITLNTKHGSVEKRQSIDKNQTWVIDNVSVGTTWNPEKFINQIGKYEELIVANRNQDIIKVYYFPDADMTFFVSKPKKEVLTWRMGKTNSL